MEHDIKDIGLADEGKKRIDWAERDMPALRAVKEQFAKEQPFAGKMVAACMHVYLCRYTN